MKQKDQIEIQLAATVKTVRAVIRMKHSLLADEEIATKLPEVEAAFYAAIAEGKPYAVDYASIFVGL